MNLKTRFFRNSIPFLILSTMDIDSTGYHKTVSTMDIDSKGFHKTVSTMELIRQDFIKL